MNRSHYQTSNQALRAARNRYPRLEFWVENGRITVIGSKPGVKLNQAKTDVRSFNSDKTFANFNPQFEYPEVHGHTIPIPTQVEKPVSSWPLPGAAAAIPAEHKTAQMNPTNAGSSRAVIQSSRGRGRSNRRRGGGRGRPTNRSRRYKIQNAALRPRKLPFRQVYDLNLTAGYADIQFKISDLVPEMLTVYEEIRVIQLSAVFLVNDAAVTAGLYTAILLDQSGYGTALKSTETWFKRVADMPGSVVHHATRGFRLTWKPTEPDSRNYVKVIDVDDIHKTIARLYVIGKVNTLSITGVLLIRGHVLCRGQYYDASKMTVNMMKDLRLAEIEEEEREEIEGELGEKEDSAVDPEEFGGFTPCTSEL